MEILVYTLVITLILSFLTFRFENYETFSEYLQIVLSMFPIVGTIAVIVNIMYYILFD